jgi:hypothetical protein
MKVKNYRYAASRRGPRLVGSRRAYSVFKLTRIMEGKSWIDAE